jgi:hypothetical protein
VKRRQAVSSKHGASGDYFPAKCAAVLLATSPVSLAAYKRGAFAPVPPLTEIFHPTANLAARLRLDFWIDFLVIIHRSGRSNDVTRHSLPPHSRSIWR